MNIKNYTICDFCRTLVLRTETTELTRDRTICDKCKKTYEEKENMNITIDHYNNMDYGTYDFDGFIKLGDKCNEDNIIEILNHEMHHHILKSRIGLLECSMWDNISTGGKIEKLLS
jgi:hypothetical protein